MELFSLPDKKIPVAPLGLTQRQMNQFSGCASVLPDEAQSLALEMSLNHVAERLETVVSPITQGLRYDAD